MWPSPGADVSRACAARSKSVLVIKGPCGTDAYGDRSAQHEKLVSTRRSIIEAADAAGVSEKQKPAKATGKPPRAALARTRSGRAPPSIMATATPDVQSIVREMLSSLDADCDGVLSREELSAGLLRRGLSSSATQLDVIMRSLDRDGDGSVGVFETLAETSKRAELPVAGADADDAEAAAGAQRDRRGGLFRGQGARTVERRPRASTPGPACTAPMSTPIGTRRPSSALEIRRPPSALSPGTRRA
jgi:hypothetical protein